MASRTLDECRDVALQVLAWLRATDAWSRAGRLDAERGQIAKRLEHLLETTWPQGQAAVQDALGRLMELARATPEAVPRAAWVEAYTGLAGSLRAAGAPVPDLRPSNLVRSVIHAMNGTLVLLALAALDDVGTRWLAVGAVVAAWGMESSRRVWPAVNRFLMTVMGPMAHPHETDRVNSATWYVSALLLLAFVVPEAAGAVAVAVLAWGDPAAGLVGRRFGRTRFANGRSAEGSLAFVAVGTVAAWGALRLVGSPGGWDVALLAAVAGAVAEQLSGRLDDNAVVPLAAGFTAALCL